MVKVIYKLFSAILLNIQAIRLHPPAVAGLLHLPEISEPAEAQSWLSENHKKKNVSDAPIRQRFLLSRTTVNIDDRSACRPNISANRETTMNIKRILGNYKLCFYW